MIRVNLSPDEIEAVRAVLAVTLSNLSYEIANTDLQDFREQLKARREALKKLIDALEQGGRENAG